MTWEIVVGVFTLATAFISAVTAAIKVNRAIVLLEEAVKRLDERDEKQTLINECVEDRIRELETRIIRLETQNLF